VVTDCVKYRKKKNGKQAHEKNISYGTFLEYRKENNDDEEPDEREEIPVRIDGFQYFMWDILSLRRA
jgi:hypothetical protein